MNPRTPATGIAGLAEYSEGYPTEDDVLASARAAADNLGCPCTPSHAGATLRFLATALCARAAVEVGTGVGVSGLYLLRGMARDGVLTSIDIEPEYHAAARAAFTRAGFPTSRARLIAGRAVDVLPRLASGGYDLVYVDAAKVEYPHYFEHGVTLLRPGGIIAFHGINANGRFADPTVRDPGTQALRELVRTVAEDERLAPVLLPVADGLLVASRAGDG
ncbi:O-methyltransferase [Haloechinothrix sp. LS1_15]|uniref:O-methyltransferase n=1 Tax=Haloechinothrix sp. LS1_15 TaxID=2652248 RepID=UPI0029441923|nr:O-methyltransferase [Haloechinothrix sp. LS1_15]MDV6013895.1 O-methyltransferase [Haloechinothrix sp. LS1_15]